MQVRAPALSLARMSSKHATRRSKTDAAPAASRNRLAPPEDDRWRAIVARDAAADGSFVYAVVTTGIYCRPSCGARRPRFENVRFFAGPAEASAAGFRPCKRCNPDAPAGSRQAALVAASCRAIESAEDIPSLAELARAAGLSPFHFHRLFKAIVGMTPKAYALAWRNHRVREQLACSRTITEAFHAAGFGSSGRFYAGAQSALGMPPATYRNGGSSKDGVMTTLRFAVGVCSLGHVLVAATAKGVAAVLLGDNPAALLRDLQDRFPNAELIGGDPAFDSLAATVIALIEHPRPAPELPLDIRGTAFQHRVWQALAAIPPGATATYGEIARRIGAPNAVRAVAAACAANPLAVIVPCHRVVRSDGAPSGYRWGLARKQALLAREARDDTER